MNKEVQRVFKFRKDVDFGSLAAENDRFLSTCFLDTGHIDILLDTSNPKRVVLGRTGTGKTALLEQMARNNKVIQIDPEALSLQYLSNSTILQYLSNLGIHLDLFYKLLWKHIFAVELIKSHYKLEDEQSQKTFLHNIFVNFGKNKKKRKAIEYLIEWSKSFWEDTEYRVKEITEKLEQKVKDEVGVNFKSLHANISENAEISREQKSDIIHKAQNAVNRIQITELNDLLELMATDIFIDPQKRYLVLIDDLDKDWVDQTVVYDLIKALLGVINDFSHTIKNVKIIIALRENILERVMRSDTKRGPQREKFSSLYLKLHWTRQELVELFELRLNEIFEGQYTSQLKPNYKDILPGKTKNRPDSMEYILDRTFLRPRDLIHFLNLCVENSIGKATISWETIKSAELEYSRSRLDSVRDEWQENYSGLEMIFKLFEGFSSTFKVEDLTDAFLHNFLESIMDIQITPVGSQENLPYQLLNQYIYQGEAAIPAIRIQMINVLHLIGFFGVKSRTYEGIKYSFMPSGNLDSADINSDTTLCIHPAFHRALGIKPNG